MIERSNRIVSNYIIYNICALYKEQIRNFLYSLMNIINFHNNQSMRGICVKCHYDDKIIWFACHKHIFQWHITESL